MTSEEPTSNKEPQIETRHIVIVLVAAVVLLVALPLGAVSIVSYSGCCGPENVITFWASMIAGFLALFGMVVTGVFIITAFRTDATARGEARHVADKAARTYLKRHRENLFEEMDTLRDSVKERGDTLVADFETRLNGESLAVSKTREGAENAVQEAEAQIARLRDGVQRRRDDAIEAITSAQQEVEAAATTAREQIDETTRALRQQDDSERPGE